MPKPSKFVTALKSHGIHDGPCDSHNCPIDLQFHRLDHVGKSGKRRDAVLQQLQGDIGSTRALLAATLPSSRSTLTTQALHCSSFVRIALWSRPSYFSKSSGPLRAMLHAEFALDTPADLDPEDPYRARTVPTVQMVMTLRLLDVHIQPQDQPEDEYICDTLAWSLVHQMFQHLGGPTSALYDLEQDYDESGGMYNDLIRFQVQGAERSPTAAAVLASFVEMFKDACERDYYEAREKLSLEDGVDIERIAEDAGFEDAIQQGITSRKSVVKPARPRAAPNGIHHVLIRDDPELRHRNGKVLNLWRLARMQITASDNRITAELEQEGIDWRDTSPEIWGPSLEDRRGKMAMNPDLEKITWVFVIDDGTHVFAAIPVLAAELTLERLLEVLDAVWRGEHGMLRGPPLRLAIPVAYLDGTRREDTASSLRARGIELVQPSSGFAAPINVVKLWCEASARIEKAYRYQSKKGSPAVVSFRYLQDWTLAHMLSEHASSVYKLEDSGHARFAFTGGGYGSHSMIKVADYALAMDLGNPLDIFLAWKARCHSDFQSDFTVQSDSGVT